MARKQRPFSAPFKFETGMETLRGEKSSAQVCGERQLTDGLVYTWRPAFLEKAPNLFETKQTAASAQSEQSERIGEMERVVGQLTMENTLLKTGSSWWEAARRRKETC